MADVEKPLVCSLGTWLGRSSQRTACPPPSPTASIEDSHPRQFQGGSSGRNKSARQEEDREVDSRPGRAAWVLEVQARGF